jgi:hypothetical protein
VQLAAPDIHCVVRNGLHISVNDFLPFFDNMIGHRVGGVSVNISAEITSPYPHGYKTSITNTSGEATAHHDKNKNAYGVIWYSLDLSGAASIKTMTSAS